jgi:hypothetical protein
MFDQQTCSFGSRLGLRRSIPFDMQQWVYQRDLKFDLLAAQRRRDSQCLDLSKSARELFHGFSQRRTTQ